MNKKWLIFGGGAAVLVIGFIVIFTVINNSHKPEKTVSSFNQAVKDNDVDTLKEMIQVDEKDVEINKQSLTSFVNYLKANNESYQVIKDGFKKQIKDDDFTSSYELVSLVEDGKTMGVFPNYKLKVTTVNLKLKGTEDDDEVELVVEGFKKPLETVEDEDDVYGPIFPGEYEVETSIQNNLGEFVDEKKVDIWGHSEVSFLIDSEKLAREDKVIQKDIIDAANKFNEDMSVYVASGFQADKFTNVSDDLEMGFTGLSTNFELAKDHVEKLESQFLESTVNMDKLDLNQFDGEWKAEVTMLVSYNEKMKLEDFDLEDFSYTEIRNFTLKYDQKKEEWIIVDLSGEDADESEADNWDNKEEIKIDDPPIRKWSEDDSFI